MILPNFGQVSLASLANALRSSAEYLGNRAIVDTRTVCVTGPKGWLNFATVARVVPDAHIGATVETLGNWEWGLREPEERFIPGIIRFLGYNPLPEAGAPSEAIRRARVTRGLSIRGLATLAGVDEARGIEIRGPT